MSITNEIYTCDHCGGDQGEFNTDTGNHPVCEENAALRSRVAALEAALGQAHDAIMCLNILDECPNCGNHFGHKEDCVLWLAESNAYTILQPDAQRDGA